MNYSQYLGYNPKPLDIKQENVTHTQEQRWQSIKTDPQGLRRKDGQDFYHYYYN